MRLLAIGLLPTTLAAQVPLATEVRPLRVGWQLVDFVIVRYDADHLTLLASPNLRSAVGGQSSVLHLRFGRIEALQWASFARQIVTRMVGTPQGDSVRILTPALQGNNAASAITLARASHRHKNSFVLIVMDSTSGRSGWSALAGTDEMNDLLDAMFIAANSPISLYGIQPVVGDSTAMSHDAVDKAPSIRGRPSMRYPLGERGAGRVWAQYVVNVEGRAEVDGIRIILSDGPGFEREVRSALSRMEFNPGEVRGHRVRVLVFQVFNFVRR